MTAGPFRGRTVAILAVVAAVSLVAGLLWAVFGPELTAPPSARSDSYSRSAVGHRAFVETLERLGIPVERSRARTAAKAGKASLFVVAEPDERAAPVEKTDVLRAILRSRRPVLVVLPKRVAWEDGAAPGRVRRVIPVARARVAAILQAVDPSLRAEIHGATAWHARDGGPVPSVDGPQVLLPARSLEPLVFADDGACLAGVVHGDGSDRGDVTVLADPDLVENHGLFRGDNAAVAAALVEGARDGDGPVVFDETLHDYGYDPSVFRELFRWPLVLALLTALAAAGVWVWAGAGRFGAPEAPPPAIEPGKAFLVENTADLLRRGGHGGHVLARYLASAVQDVARSTQAPAGLSGEALDEWLARVGEARGASASLPALRRRAEAARAAGPRDGRALVAAAMAVHAWRKEMTDGPR